MFFALKEKTIFDAHEYYLAGKYDKALQLCEQILAVNPGSYSALNIIANIYFITGDFDKGEQYLYKLKEYFVRKKDYDKAIGVMHRLDMMKPEKEKYLREIADLYHLSGRENLRIRQFMHMSEICRKNGRFKNSANLLLELSRLYTNNPEMDKLLINKIAMIGELDVLGTLAHEKILNAENLTREEKDDIILLCADLGCNPELIIEHIPFFLSGGKGRLEYVEHVLYKYFIANDNKPLLEEIVHLVGIKEFQALLDRISAEAPENVPVFEDIEEASISEPVMDIFVEDAEPELVIEASGIDIESHIQKAEDDILLEKLDLDNFETEDDMTAVDVSLDGLEKFDAVDEIADVEQISGLESFEIADVGPVQVHAEPEVSEKSVTETLVSLDVFAEPEKRAEDIFAAFGEENSPDSGDDIFADFDNPKISDTPIKQSDDMFSDLVEEKPEEIKDDIQQIDMSDITIETKEKKDIFEGMVEEKTEVVEKEPAQKITIDASELKKSEKDGKDIFDMEI